MGLYPTPANPKRPQSDHEKWRNCQACFGVGSMHASRVESQTVGNTELDSGTPNVQKVFTTLFSHRTGVWGQKGLEFCLDKQQNQGTNCVMWHMKQSIWSTDLERPLTHKVTTSLVPRFELCNHKKKIPWGKIQELSCWIWGLNLLICISIIEHWKWVLVFWHQLLNIIAYTRL